MKWLLLFLLIIPELCAEGALDVESFSAFPGGLNSKEDSRKIKSTQAQDCRNVWFDEIQGVQKRKGFTKALTLPSTGTKKNSFVLNLPSGEQYYLIQIDSTIYSTSDLSTLTNIKTGISWQLNQVQVAYLNRKAWITTGVDSVASYDGTDYIEYDFIFRGKLIESHKNMLFVANTYDEPSRVYFHEEINLPSEEVGWEKTNFITVNRDDGDWITALKSFRGRLYIFKNNSIWVLIGTFEENWILHKVDGYIGCVSAETLQERKGKLIFMSHIGMVEFDGARVKKIDKSVDNITKNSNNLRGYSSFINYTTTEELDNGTTNFMSFGEDELKLLNRTKNWTDFTVADGTFTKLNNGSIVLNSTFTYAALASSSVYSNVMTIDRRYTSHDFSEYLNRRTVEFVENNTTLWGTHSDNPYDNPDYINDGKMDTGGRLVEVNYLESGGGAATITNLLTQEYADKFIPIYKSEIDMDIDNLYSIRIKANLKIKQLEAFRGTVRVILRIKVRNEIGDYTTICDKRIHSFPRIPTAYGVIGNVEEYLYDETFDVDNIVIDRVLVDIMFLPAEMRYHWDCLCYVSPFYEILLKGRDLSGTSVYDSSNTATVNHYDWEQTVHFGSATPNNYVPTHSTITYNFYSSLDNSIWSTCTFTNWQATDGYVITPSSGRYGYWKAVLLTGATTNDRQPEILGLEIAAITSTGSWTGDKANLYQVNEHSYIILDYDDEGQTIILKYRTAGSEAGLDSHPWTTVTVISGELVVAPSSHTWIQAYVFSSTDDGKRNPKVYSLSYTWYPEKKSVLPATGVIDERYWFSLSTGNYSENNYILVYDKNDAWTLFDGYNAQSFNFYRKNYYFLKDGTCYLYKLNDGYADDGVDIEAYFVTKDYGLGNINMNKNMEYIYTSFAKSGTGNIEVGYMFDYETSYSTYSVSISSLVFVDDRQRFQGGDYGKTVRFRMKESSSNEPFKFLNANVYFKRKELR